jgi:hypothetical protein
VWSDIRGHQHQQIPTQLSPYHFKGHRRW